MEFQPDDRVKTRHDEILDRTDGTSEVFIPAGHGGVVVETFRFAAGQVHWHEVRVRLDPINGVNYLLKTEPIFFEKEQ